MARKGTTEQAAARRVQALELRKSGATYRQIGERLDVSEAQAHADVQHELKVLAETAQEAADEVRALELARLDALLAALWPQQGEPAVVDRVLRIMERRAKLLGLDAPTRVDAVLDIYEVTIGGRGDDNPA